MPISIYYKHDGKVVGAYHPDSVKTVKNDFIKLFSSCFEDDPKTILDSISRAYLWVVYEGDEPAAFMLYNPYPEIKAVVIEYVGVAESQRGHGLCPKLFERLYTTYCGWAFFGECHLDTPIIRVIESQGWKVAPVNWVCPAWGDIPEDRTRHLMCREARKELIPKFAKMFYDYGYGVSRDDLVEGYRRELGL